MKTGHIRDRYTDWTALVFDPSEQQQLAADPQLSLYPALTSQHVVGLLDVCGNYLARRSWREPDELGMESSVHTPEIAAAHRILVECCRRQAILNDEQLASEQNPFVFSLEEQAELRLYKYVHGSERITHAQLIELLRAIRIYSAVATPAPLIPPSEFFWLFNRYLHAHQWLVRFGREPFTDAEFIDDLYQTVFSQRSAYASRHERRATATMSQLRKYSLAAGIFYLLTFVSIPTLALYKSVKDPQFVVGPGPDTPIIVGVLLEMIVALANIGTAVALYPVLRRQGQARAVGFVASRLLEAATMYVGIVSLMSIVTLRRSGAGSAAVVAAQGLAAQYQWTFFFAQSFIPAINGMLLGSLLYQSRLVPRWLPTLAFIGAGLLTLSWFVTLAGGIPAISAVAALAALPIAVWEFSLGIYLTFWGFKPSPITSDMETSATSTT